MKNFFAKLIKFESFKKTPETMGERKFQKGEELERELSEERRREASLRRAQQSLEKRVKGIKPEEGIDLSDKLDELNG